MPIFLWVAPVRPELPRPASAKHAIAGDAEINDPASEKKTVGSETVLYTIAETGCPSPVMGHLMSVISGGDDKGNLYIVARGSVF